jgi:uncharacterized membrane protein
MTIPFIFFTLFLFVALFFYETQRDPTQPQIKQMGLLTWISSGNWPAKVGAGLLILGIGALIRYALIHIDMPPSLKLGSGFVMSALLSGAAYILRNQPKRRAIRLSLGGVAAGVAYLTAYSAYDFFGYINGIQALTLLGLVALATGYFAVSSRALSVAILAMTGAYLAPAFALKIPGPLEVYGYYTAVSMLVLIMVTLRGWRGLIHLSFLFTLAGALFMGWTARLYQPEYYSIMQPFLLAITALHLAMPLAERKQVRSTWISRFDLGYFLALPAASFVLTLFIAPRLRVEGVLGVGLLSLVWAAAAVILKFLKREEALPHGLVAAALLAAAVVCRLEDVPWLILGLCLSVALLAMAPFLGIQKENQNPLCGLILLFGFLNFSASIQQASFGRIFLNEFFAERMVIALSLAATAWLSRRRKITMDSIIGWVAAGWTVLMTALELQRLQIDFLPQLIYGLLLCIAVAMAFVARRRLLPPALSILLGISLAGCGWWAAFDFPGLVTYLFLLLTPAALLFLVGCLAAGTTDDRPGAEFIVSMLPVILIPWALATSGSAGVETGFLSATLVVAAVLLSALAARIWLSNSLKLNTIILPVYFGVLSLSLFGVTTLHIEQNIWAILFECLTLVFLISFTTTLHKSDRQPSIAFGTVTVVAASLVLQAMLLRCLGPDRVLTMGDLRHMHLPTAVSLLWAVFGAGLTWWGGKNQSRPLWSAGAALLVLAAIKLVLFDFGSLGQLGNILSMIAAGLVFMGVAWFAPLPPKKPAKPKSQTPPVPPPGTRQANAAATFNFESQAAAPESASAAPSSQHSRREQTPPITARNTAQATSKEELSQNRINTLIKFIVFCGVLLIIFIGGFLVQNLFKQHRKPALQKPQEQKSVQVPQHQAGLVLPGVDTL